MKTLEEKRASQKKYDSKYYTGHKEEIALRCKEYSSKHKDQKSIANAKYRKDHKEQIALCNKKYRETHKEHIKKYKVDHKKEIAIRQRKYVQTLTKELRQQIIELYSHGTCKCSHCSGSVEELHHTDPANGKWEKKEFGSKTTLAARKHQLEMYTVIPDYITPLCKKCHKDLHTQFKEEK